MSKFNGSASGSSFAARAAPGAQKPLADNAGDKPADKPSPTAGSRCPRDEPRAYRWVVAPPPQNAQELLRGMVQMGLHPMAARVLMGRGWTPGGDLGRFISPLLKNTLDPFLMKDMDKACDRLARAVAEREPVLVYGDYDVDGSTSTALLVSLFRHLNVPVRYYIPNRLTEGYGLNVEALEHLAKRFRLIVTVDTGTTGVAEADWARRHGVDLVITDHHRAGETLPEAVALVNPNRPDCAYPEKTLAGVGVAFKLAHALLKRLDSDPKESVVFLRSLLDLVAIGTICDMVPLTGENRAFASHGLKVISQPVRPGLRALKLISGFEFDQEISPQQIGFGLGPRINAAGRTAKADTAVDLLLEEDECEAFRKAEKLDSLNENRRDIERKLLDDAMREIDLQCDLDNEKIVVCAGRGWHLGIIGIVASRVLDHFTRPSIICAISGEDDIAKGSGRSVTGFNLHQALHDCSDLLLGFGGHAHAAGLQLEAAKVPAFREAINGLAVDRLDDDDLVPRLNIDAEVEFDELSFEAARALDDLAPFGQSNKPPLLMSRGLTIDGAPRVVGRNHLKMRARRGAGAPIEIIGFGQAHHLKAFMQGLREVDVCGVPSINHFRGTATLQFELRDLRPAERPGPAEV